MITPTTIRFLRRYWRRLIPAGLGWIALLWALAAGVALIA